MAFCHGNACASSAALIVESLCVSTSLALIAFGANLGNPAAQVRAAIAGVRDAFGAPDTFRVSSLWGSRPVDCPPEAPDFVNAVCAIELATHTPPLEILDVLQALEVAAGRVRSVRNAPRRLDLDLIAFGALQVNLPRLSLPHPRAHERAFVVVPAAEVASGFTRPGMNLALGDLALRVPGREGLWRHD